MAGVLDTEGFKKIILSHGDDPVMKRLKTMLQKRLKAASIEHEEDYENPNWANKQAYKNGIRKTLIDLLTLLEFVG